MNEQEILAEFTDLLRDLLADDSIVLGMETKRADVPNWDSFQYVNFIVAVEVKFGIKFRIADVEAFETVGDIVVGTKTLRNPTSAG
jgi:acyl carrier protein